jgi:hypothetical protein
MTRRVDGAVHTRVTYGRGQTGKPARPPDARELAQAAHEHQQQLKREFLARRASVPSSERQPNTAGSPPGDTESDTPA